MSGELIRRKCSRALAVRGHHPYGYCQACGNPLPHPDSPDRFLVILGWADDRGHLVNGSTNWSWNVPLLVAHVCSKACVSATDGHTTRNGPTPCYGLIRAHIEPIPYIQYCGLGKHDRYDDTARRADAIAAADTLRELKEANTHATEEDLQIYEAEPAPDSQGAQGRC